jgi:hypothetical protein
VFAVDIVNHLPRKKDGKVSSRADEWNGYHDEQMLSLFRVFGCLAIVRKEPDQVRMGEKQMFRGVFLGFATQYNVLNIESRKVVSARTVQFNETQFPFRTGKVVVPRLADYVYGESKTSEHQSALPSSSVSVSPQYIIRYQNQWQQQTCSRNSKQRKYNKCKRQYRKQCSKRYNKRYSRCIFMCTRMHSS